MDFRSSSGVIVALGQGRELKIKHLVYKIIKLCRRCPGVNNREVVSSWSR